MEQSRTPRVPSSSQNKAPRSLLCSTGSKIKSKKALASWPCGEQASAPCPWARASWQGRVSTRLSMGAGWQRAGPRPEGSRPTQPQSGRRGAFAAVSSALVWQGDLERGQGCGINYSRLPCI